MHTEWTDAQLDGFWASHLSGALLPPLMTGQQGILGAQLIITNPPSKAIWTRVEQPVRGRLWLKTVVIG
jgi:hypothetical protein